MILGHNAEERRDSTLSEEPAVVSIAVLGQVAQGHYAAGYFFERCASAEAAAVLVAALDRPSRNAFEAAVAAVADVTLAGDDACDSALPAADLEVAPVELLPRTPEALVAARGLVTLEAMIRSKLWICPVYRCHGS